MPNHVINRITPLSPTTMGDLIGALCDEGGGVDFNRVIPMPVDEPGFISEGGLSWEAQKASKGRNWYDWSCENWGTKWNAYSFPEGGQPKDGAVEFQTAWAMPEPVMRKLAEAGLCFLWEYADEDIGNNCGTYTAREGVVSRERGDADYARRLWGEF